MQGEAPAVDAERLNPGQFVVDTVYHPMETPLLAAARARGIPCANGLGMLVHQAALAFELLDRCSTAPLAPCAPRPRPGAPDVTVLLVVGCSVLGARGRVAASIP